MMQGDCISQCFARHSKGVDLNAFPPTPIMKMCSIETCRRKYDKKDGSSGGKATLAHIVKSMYAFQLKMWFEYFSPRQFYIFTLEQFIANPILQMEKIFDFLGLPLYDASGRRGFRNRREFSDILSFTKNITPKRPEVLAQVTDDMRAKLIDYFRPHNKLLLQVLGWDPGYQI